MNPGNSLETPPLSGGQAKISEYADQIEAGKPIESIMQGLKGDGVFRDGIEKELFRREQARKEKVDKQALSPEKAQDHVNAWEKMPVIPKQYEGLDSETLDFIWTVPEYADPEKTRQEQERKNRAIQAVRAKESSMQQKRDREWQDEREIEKVRNELGIPDMVRNGLESNAPLLDQVIENKLYGAQEFLEFLHVENEHVKSLLESGLREKIIEADVNVIFVSSPREDKAHVGGWFDAQSNTIVIQKPFLVAGYERMLSGQKRGGGKYENIQGVQTFQEYADITLVHEMIHSVTTVAVNMDRATQPDGTNKFLSPNHLRAVAELKRITQDIQKFDLKEYGTENTDELLAEIANKGFLEKLARFPDPKNTGQTYRDTLLKQYQFIIENPIKNPYFSNKKREDLVQLFVGKAESAPWGKNKESLEKNEILPEGIPVEYQGRQWKIKEISRHIYEDRDGKKQESISYNLERDDGLILQQGNVKKFISRDDFKVIA